MQRQATIEKNPRVAYREYADGERAVLLDLETGAYFGINRIGSRIWALLDENVTMDRLLADLATELEDAPENLEADVERFLGALHERGLISY
jgi:hypothetical protein